MEKKIISVHAVTIHAYTIVIILLVLIVGVLGLKYLHLKLAMNQYTSSAIWLNSQNSPSGLISDYGAIIATTASGYIKTTDLQGYITSLSNTLKRDIVVVDKTHRILADTVGANKGGYYTSDKGELKLTIEDGKERIFEEKSVDYPSGVSETVVPMRNANNEIIGAVIISNSTVK